MTAFRTRVTASVAVALLSAGVLAGCSLPSPGDVIGGLVEQGVEDATGADISRGGVPADFPAEVPLAEGDVQLGIGIPASEGQKGWNVTIATTQDAAAIRAQLEAAGFAAVEGAELLESSAPTGTIIVSNGAYDLVVVVTDDDQGGHTANYTVTTHAQ